MSNLVLKIKTSLDNDIRLFKGEFNDLEDAFSKLALFINKVYRLDDKVKYIMQYIDDENDLVTISSKLDLQDAIEQANNIKKHPKIFIKLRNTKHDGRPESAKPKNNNNNNNDTKEDINDDKLDELTGVLYDDLCNNDEFKKEFISFLSTIVLLYQSNGNGNDKMDLTTCIVTSLSKHINVAGHKQIKVITSKLNMIIPQIEIFASLMLLGFDVKNVEIMVNKFVENRKNGMHDGLGFPFMMLSNIFNNVDLYEEKNCPGKHGLKSFKTPSASYTCDGCNAHMNSNSPMYGCRKCNFDLCPECYGINDCGFGEFQGRFGIPCGTLFGGPFQVPFGCGFRPGGPFGYHVYDFGSKCGRRGRRPKHGSCSWNKYNKKNNNNNNNNNVNDKEKTLKADIIQNIIPKVSNFVDSSQGIMKTWKLKNTGSKNLPKGLIVKYSGRKNNPMVTTKVFYIGNKDEIKPGETFEVTICIKTPQIYGRFSSNWRLFTPDGKKFGQKLPFYLVLSPPNNDEQKIDGNLKGSETDEDKDNNNNEKKIDIITDDNNNNDNSIDMEVNDSDDSSIVIVTEPRKNEPKVELKKDQAKPEPYPYQKQLNQIKTMGIVNNDDYIKGLLNASQGNINNVIRLLFDNNNLIK